jgi:hypothetical protein
MASFLRKPMGISLATPAGDRNGSATGSLLRDSTWIPWNLGGGFRGFTLARTPPSS